MLSLRVTNWELQDSILRVAHLIIAYDINLTLFLKFSYLIKIWSIYSKIKVEYVEAQTILIPPSDFIKIRFSI